MTDISRAFHDLAFDRDFMRCRGNAFQSFFIGIMERRYPGDFVQVRPYGPMGDLKNDGYLTSQEAVFQCYGPNEVRPAQTTAKMDEDFAGAKLHWPGLKKWVFVHNAWDGLPPPVLAKLIELRTANPDVVIEPMGRQELLLEARQLSLADRNTLFGLAPDVSTFASLGFDDLQPIVEAIENQPPIDDADVRPVPPDKIAYNRLSADVEHTLALGKARYDLVDQYFAKHPDPTLGDKIGRALTAQYSVLRGQGLSPDMIFAGLQTFTIGSARATPQREAACFAILAYFFEQCDIFERPPTP